MTDRYVGFYWTMPVNWAGFRTLPTDPEAAAKKSKTIRYQVERVRRDVDLMKGELVGEFVYMEISPDRATSAVVESLKGAIALCASKDATLLYVNFADAHYWRKHTFMISALEESGIMHEALSPDPIMIGGRQFDPVYHFRGWRAFHESERGLRRDRALSELFRVRNLGLGSHQAICDELNARGVPTKTGVAWTAECVRKTLKRHG